MLMALVAPLLSLVVCSALGVALGSVLVDRDASPDVPPSASLQSSAQSAIAPRAAALDFSGSTWIWTNEVNGGNAPVGARAFRKNFVAPYGKTPVSADILITVDNSLTLYVNGLEPCLNVFAVTAVNGATAPNLAGLLAAIQITYSDGTTSKIVSDTTWRASPCWMPATAEGAYGVGPWGQIAIPSDPPTLSLTNANWIWTNEVVNGKAPPGSHAFRRTYTPPAGLTATSATIIMVADNEYSLYVNGVLVGSGTDFHVAQRYTVNLAPAPNVVFAVYATNTATVNNPAGLLAAIEINSAADCNCTAGAFLITDGSWKYNTGTPAGFQLPGYDDSAWPNAFGEGAEGVAPWGTTTVVSAPGPINAIAGAPASNQTNATNTTAST
ncbi:hypothetical protein B0H10DRAFT_2432905 [Mycena sp. CBHHK59/15]|nr:hypothetical protein B0H10DRAFT_2432905 [Mycena sp. CBHHK59/15]